MDKKQTEKVENLFANLTKSYQNTMDSDLDETPPVPEPEPVSEAAPEAEPQPEVTEEAIPETAEASEETPAPTIETPTPTEPEPQPQAQSAEEYAAQQQQQLEKYRETLIEHYKAKLPEDMFIDQAQRDAMAGLFADSELRGYQSALQAVSQQAVPLVQQILNASKQNERLEQEFFEMWPGLRKTEYQKDIEQYARIFAQENPQATPQDLMRKVGGAVCAVHQLNPDTTMGNSQKETPTPSAPSPVAATPTPAPQPLRTNGGADASAPEAPRGPVTENSEEWYGTLAANYEP